MNKEWLFSLSAADREIAEKGIEFRDNELISMDSEMTLEYEQLVIKHNRDISREQLLIRVGVIIPDWMKDKVG